MAYRDQQTQNREAGVVRKETTPDGMDPSIYQEPCDLESEAEYGGWATENAPTGGVPAPAPVAGTAGCMMEASDDD